MAPTMPALQASITNCGPDTRNMGAAMAGSCSRSARDARKAIGFRSASRGPAEAAMVQHHGLSRRYAAAERRLMLAGAPGLEAQHVAGPHRTREANVEPAHARGLVVAQQA